MGRNRERSMARMPWAWIMRRLGYGGTPLYRGSRTSSLSVCGTVVLVREGAKKKLPRPDNPDNHLFASTNLFTRPIATGVPSDTCTSTPAQSPCLGLWLFFLLTYVTLGISGIALVNCPQRNVMICCEVEYLNDLLTCTCCTTQSKAPTARFALGPLFLIHFQVAFKPSTRFPSANYLLCRRPYA